MIHVGLDVGSTTAKAVALDASGAIVFQTYRRHFSDIKAVTLQIMQDLEKTCGETEMTFKITGSSGLAIAKFLKVAFIQEVIACTEAVEQVIPETDVVIELGGEDAKIVYFSGGIEQRMNNACAGGTGAFIDQIAMLLQTDPNGLNDLAKGAEMIYPIASRCGVFAKTDVQPLLNEGARKEDIAASIFQSVVTQTISGLACGRPIRGKVAFLGGPLTFLDQLRYRFTETLKMKESDIIAPANAEYFIALGAAYNGWNDDPVEIEDMIARLRDLDFSSMATDTTILPALFTRAEDLVAFRERHNQMKAPRGDLASYEGDVYLGIDAGSTTTKLVLMGADNEILYSFYDSNKGNPLQSVIDATSDLYEILPEKVKIRQSGITGYGESLIKAALKIDVGEIETVAHYRAAREFLPDVDFILDIGGQDMKCMKMKNQALDSLMLNEACSAGCGSFLETFAQTLGVSIQDFADKALQAREPVDLGSRCTVFMNSKVKQVQKEGVQMEDLSAGLAYSVVKNALQKVIKLRSPKDIGNKVIVQGGTFYNEAVLRAFELLTEREVVRPDIAGMMGAYGAALIAKENYETGEVTQLLVLEKLREFQAETSQSRCNLCSNSCQLTITRFGDDRKFVSGNRCERGERVESEKNLLPNLYAYKYKRVFDYKSLKKDEATRGTIGIPRALNVFENYPLWHTIFTELGFQVKLSMKSSKNLYEKGIETIASEAVCYPAKLTHGHVMDLIKKKVDRIFYPAVVYENKEFGEATNNFNCPVVAGYPEVIRVNMDALEEQNVPLIAPFLTLDNEAALVKGMHEAFPDVPRKEMELAVAAGLLEARNFRDDIRQKGEEALEYIEKNKIRGIVLCGHPYHIDPEVNHGLPELITMNGMAVLTEDSVSHLGEIKHPLRVENQWKYHARLYRAASFVAEQENLEVVQMTSFGCGLDAITTDMVQEIIEGHNKVYTLLKVDEINNLGAARIRIRSLKAAMDERARNHVLPTEMPAPKPRVMFTKEMRKTYTILAPQLAPTHFELVEAAGHDVGYKLEVLPAVTPRAVDEGLRYVNNDACFPAILTIGQMMDALKHGDYDLDNLAVLMTQTGGGCRATNYISMLKKALGQADLDHIPVISLNANGLEKQPGFKITPKVGVRFLVGLCLGDGLDRMLYKTRPHEVIPGSANKLHRHFIEKGKEVLANYSPSAYAQFCKEMVMAFDSLPLREEVKPKVGVVGEILVKFHPGANNDIVGVIEEEGGEAVVPDFVDFLLYCCYDSHFAANSFGMSKVKSFAKHSLAIPVINKYRKPMSDALRSSKRFCAPENIEVIAEKASRLLSLGNKMGEGWFLTGEMIELLDSDVPNIACLQPFACLPNHITGRGMIKGLKKMYPAANIMSIDYDAGSSSVNQLNRIKLMLSIAKKQLEKVSATESKVVAKKEGFHPKEKMVDTAKRVRDSVPIEKIGSTVKRAREADPVGHIAGKVKASTESETVQTES
ncbi:2-hydroxyacyl-CoA dehydratase [Listeria rustica]|uniref:2-hydroxyacyl-CoA dehydratase n=1 Tax=Listeria rustica TaxID=2713503 RepID=A0A7W1T3R7_9LIST|nr:2-hydroxyacyl-CoA dehydratase [Listeria rustica]MBA3924771.1 2-hydroxyacyl-CoA dehydratase [Listeria rustica]